MKIFISPHPDDETLGCGGTILKNPGSILVLITKHKNNKKNLIDKAIKSYNFKKVFKLNFSASKMHIISHSLFIDKISNIVNLFKNTEIYIPSKDDLNTDHKIINELSISALRLHRCKDISKIIIYEVLSESNLYGGCFKPNYYENIEKYIQKKIEIFKLYKNEVQNFPNPRSTESIEALSKFRGSQSGYNNAEAFQIIFSKGK
jgi:LmbE family N-acetylglucosaminyl deacetylase